MWNDSEKKQTGKNGRCNFFVFFFFFFFLEKTTAIESVIGFRGLRVRRGDVTPARYEIF